MNIQEQAFVNKYINYNIVANFNKMTLSLARVCFEQHSLQEIFGICITGAFTGNAWCKTFPSPSHPGGAKTAISQCAGFKFHPACSSL